MSGKLISSFKLKEIFIYGGITIFLFSVFLFIKPPEQKSVLMATQEESIKLGIKLSVLPSDENLVKFYRAHLNDNSQLTKDDYDTIMVSIKKNQAELNKLFEERNRQIEEEKHSTAKEAAITNLKSFDEVGYLIFPDETTRHKVRLELVKKINETKD